jgi:hypothetical protein
MLHQPTTLLSKQLRCHGRTGLRFLARPFCRQHRSAFGLRVSQIQRLTRLLCPAQRQRPAGSKPFFWHLCDERGLQNRRALVVHHFPTRRGFSPERGASRKSCGLLEGIGQQKMVGFNLTKLKTVGVPRFIARIFISIFEDRQNKCSAVNLAGSTHLPKVRGQQLFKMVSWLSVIGRINQRLQCLELLYQNKRVFVRHVVARRWVFRSVDEAIITPHASPSPTPPPSPSARRRTRGFGRGGLWPWPTSAAHARPKTRSRASPPGPPRWR